MKKKLFMLMYAVLFMSASTMAQSGEKTYLRGDANMDGEIGMPDIMYILQHILTGKYPDEEEQEQSPLICPNDNHPHMIDLGLPSRTKWACCNEGASVPEQYGGYYYFGEVSNVPSFAQIEELINNCSSTWTHFNGVSGRLFTGTNGNSIFLPAAGAILDKEYHEVGGREPEEDYYVHVGEYGMYWSSTPYEDSQEYSSGMSFTSVWISGISKFYNYDRRSVRPVR